MFSLQFSKSMVFDVYSEFVNNFTLAMETAKKLAKQKQAFADFLKVTIGLDNRLNCRANSCLFKTISQKHCTFLKPFVEYDVTIGRSMPNVLKMRTLTNNLRCYKTYLDDMENKGFLLIDMFQGNIMVVS